MPDMTAKQPEQQPLPPPAPPYDDGTPDILDPAVPPEALEALRPPVAPVPLPALVLQHEALLQGFCTALQERLSHWILDHHKNMERVLDVTYAACKSRLEAIGTQNEHATYSMADALAKLQEKGIQVTTNPYQAKVLATSPQGFGVEIMVAKQDAGSLMEAVTGITGWLAGNEYKPLGEGLPI